VAPDDPAVVLATTDYGVDFASIIGRDHVFGIQFHPEKSQEIGLRILRNFASLVESGTVRRPATTEWHGQETGHNGAKGGI
jgi:GMP synthase-like glutamine amidotransferase